MELVRKTFRLPRGCEFNKIEVRECNGHDEQRAALVAKDSDGTSVYMELVRLSIVSVDGTPVRPPGSADIESWRSRTRKAVAAYFDALNDVSDAELGPLVAEAMIDGAINADDQGDDEEETAEA